MDEESKVLLTSIANKVDGLGKRMTSFNERMTSFDGRMSSFDDKMTSVEGKMSSFEELQTKTLAVIIDVKETMKEKMATKDELHTAEDRITTHIDGFIKMHETIDVEQASLRGACDRHEARITKLEKERVGA
ncbi:MAG: hypothetical protein Q8P11_04270 [bacterium]|nr:hypothetical protein [bacterium]